MIRQAVYVSAMCSLGCRRSTRTRTGVTGRIAGHAEIDPLMLFLRVPLRYLCLLSVR